MAEFFIKALQVESLRFPKPPFTLFSMFDKSRLGGPAHFVGAAQSI
jgi:hypothetical protein